MRILVVSDFHADPARFRWLTEQGESGLYDMVAICGDLLSLNGLRPIEDEQQIDSCLSRLRKLVAIVAVGVCSGNHDSYAGGGRLNNAWWLKELKAESRNVWIDGDSWQISGQTFRSISWDDDGKLPEADGDAIWLAHRPPCEAPTGICRGGAGWGNLALGEMCRGNKGPWLALSGHVHDPQSWFAKIGRTWSLNAGCSNRIPPNHFIIDLSRRVVAWNTWSHTDFLKL
jgi:Icc-related predicted phosphoesterase